MTRIYLLAEVGVADGVLDPMVAALQDAFGCVPERVGGFRLPADAFDATRRQFSAPALLHRVASHVPHDGTRLLGIVTPDIFIPMLRYIFGQAQLNGSAALISLARLQPEFYGLAPDPALLAQRATKEALHELGHAFGLRHCSNMTCTMSLSTTIAHVDLKQAAFCVACATLLDEMVQ